MEERKQRKRTAILHIKGKYPKTWCVAKRRIFFLLNLLSKKDSYHSNPSTSNKQRTFQITILPSLANMFWIAVKMTFWEWARNKLAMPRILWSKIKLLALQFLKRSMRTGKILRRVFLLKIKKIAFVTKIWSAKWLNSPYTILIITFQRQPLIKLQQNGNFLIKSVSITQR